MEKIVLIRRTAVFKYVPFNATTCQDHGLWGVSCRFLWAMFVLLSSGFQPSEGSSRGEGLRKDG